MSSESVKSNDLVVAILAAGEGTRMKSKYPKVLHPLAGMPMINYVLDIALSLNAQKILVVVGHKAEQVKQGLAGYNIEFVMQPEQLGTGDAVRRVKEHLGDFEGNILILNADVPLISRETLLDLVNQHGQCPITMLTTKLDNPTGYGRIIRDSYGDVRGIVEEKDASSAQKKVKEICSGIYCFQAAYLFDALSRLTTNNAQGEYYLTDVIGIFRRKGIPIHTHCTENSMEVLGINDRVQMAKASKFIRQEILKRLMRNGVTIIDPQNTYIDYRTTIGRDTIIEPTVMICGKCVIGEDCHIGPFTVIKDSQLQDGVTVQNSCSIDQSIIKENAAIGPFARIRPESVIEEGARIGNFVETKKTTVGKGSKVSHLTYLGDAVLGEGVNIGAGTITCNYDGDKKHKTTIKDGVFVGSGSQLVAPVTVGEKSYIGAGSTITQDVPAYSLALTRAKETQKPKWVKRRKKDKPKE